MYTKTSSKEATFMYTTMNVIRACDDRQTHTHEFLGSTNFTGPGDLRHNHRFAGVTGEAIHIGRNQHIHEYRSNTDFVEEHYHVIKGKTGPDIELPDGNHIHYEDTLTTFDEGHKHDVEFATLIAKEY